MKRRFRKLFYSALGCGLILLSLYKATHFKCAPVYSGPQERSQLLLECYDYPKQTINAKVEKIDETQEYVIKRVEFPSTVNVFGEDNNIRINYYEQKRDGKSPTILIFPILGGISFSVKSFANYFASNGFNCAIVRNKKFKIVGDLEEIENFLRQGIINSRQVIDYLVQQEKVDKDRLGSFGISLGGIKVAITAGVDERLRCNVMCLAGGSIADIICYTTERGVVKQRKKVMEERGLTLEELHAELSGIIRSDPLKLAPYMDGRNVLMYIGLFDKGAPRECGIKLWNAIGKPEVIYLLAGHYNAVLYLPYARRKSLGFFRKKFGMK